MDMPMPLFDLSYSLATAHLAVQGGRRIYIWKQKGDAAVCGNSRGILVSYHLSKRYYTPPAEPMFQAVQLSIGPAQCGAATRQCAPLMATSIHTFIDRNLSDNTAWAMLLLDLAKALDPIIREYLYGADQIRIDELADEPQTAGISKGVALEVHHYLQHQ